MTAAINKVMELGDKVPPDVRDQLILSELIAMNTQLKSNSERLRRIEEANAKEAKIRSEYPSLLYLLKHDTSRTVAFIVVGFIILSAFWVGTVRAAALKWLGLPVF